MFYVKPKKHLKIGVFLKFVVTNTKILEDKKMKYRIIQFENGKFQVQERNLFYWVKVYLNLDDYLDNDRESNYENYLSDVFPTLEVAKAKLKKIIDKKEKEKCAKKFKVIEKY